MDYVCSLTGKSPSTTGAGSEGALTKGPFNALMPSIDLNAIGRLDDLDRTGWLQHAGRSHRSAVRSRSRHLVVDPGSLVPAWDPTNAIRSNLIDAGMLEKIEDFRARRCRRSRPVDWVSDHTQIRAHLPGSRLRQSVAKSLPKRFCNRNCRIRNPSPMAFCTSPKRKNGRHAIHGRRRLRTGLSAAASDPEHHGAR